MLLDWVGHWSFCKHRMHGIYSTSKTEAKTGHKVVGTTLSHGRTENKYNKLKGIPTIYRKFSGIVLSIVVWKMKPKRMPRVILLWDFSCFVLSSRTIAKRSNHHHKPGKLGRTSSQSDWLLISHFDRSMSNRGWKQPWYFRYENENFRLQTLNSNQLLFFFPMFSLEPFTDSCCWMPFFFFFSLKAVCIWINEKSPAHNFQWKLSCEREDAAFQ